jgi:hypothetical protein
VVFSGPAMRRLLATSLLACLVLAPRTAVHAAVVTGTVTGEGAWPIAGATVRVVPGDAAAPCATTSGPDGGFTIRCGATGRHAVRAVFGDLRPWEVEDVELAADREVHLNVLLLPASGTAPSAAPDAPAAEPDGFWTRRVPNPELAAWRGRPITLRALAIVGAALSFPLGALAMLWLGRHLGVQTRSLSPGEVGDMVLDPHMPAAGARVTPVAVVGARGASATVSYGGDEIAAAFAARRYGVVVVALGLAPGLFALFSLGFAVATLVGQEAYLLYGMLLVPAGFLLTPLVIGIQALARRR